MGVKSIMNLKSITDSQLRTIAWVFLAIAFVLLITHPDIALAQGDPFATAKEKACQAQNGLRQLAGALGVVGMVACLMLGFFNKLNWKWLSTGIGVCFAINLVPTIIGFLAQSPSC